MTNKQYTDNFNFHNVILPVPQKSRGTFVFLATAVVLELWSASASIVSLMAELDC